MQDSLPHSARVVGYLEQYLSCMLRSGTAVPDCASDERQRNCLTLHCDNCADASGCIASNRRILIINIFISNVISITITILFIIIKCLSL